MVWYSLTIPYLSGTYDRKNIKDVLLQKEMCQSR